MAIPYPRSDREYQKFGETELGDTAVRVLSDIDANLIKFDADDSAPDYIGLNENLSASDDDSDWVVLKFTYSGSNVTQIQRAKGTWTGRAGLF
jgi:hypothetical protein